MFFSEKSPLSQLLRNGRESPLSSACGPSTHTWFSYPYETSYGPLGNRLYFYKNHFLHSAMDIFRTESCNIPQTLYRVDYDDTLTTYDSEMGFQAGDTTTFLSDFQIELFVISVEAHRDWHSRIRSPYISLFSDRENAENWATRWELYNSRPCQIVEIDGTRLADSRVYCVRDLQNQFGLSGPRNSEYLCLHRIPKKAIVSRQSTQNVVNCRLENRPANSTFGNTYLDEWSRSKIPDHRRRVAVTYWDPKPHDYYISVKEVEITDVNDC
jgi:hypothetical protein